MFQSSYYPRVRHAPLKKIFHGEIIKVFRVKKKRKEANIKHQGIMGDHESKLVKKNKVGPSPR